MRPEYAAAIVVAGAFLALLIWVIALGDYPWRWLRRPPPPPATFQRDAPIPDWVPPSFAKPAAKGISSREERARIIATSERPREFL